jgi:hypothetical protein
LDNVNQTQGFDLAIKVKQEQQGPNVLWFNDKYKTIFSQECEPVAGAVVAVQSGTKALQLANELGTLGLGGAKYEESYDIFLPDDNFVTGSTTAIGDEAITDLYMTYVDGPAALDTALSSLGAGVLPASTGLPIWVTSILNTQSDGTSAEANNCATTVWDTTVQNSAGSYVIPVDADIFGLWEDVVPCGIALHQSTDTATETVAPGSMPPSDSTICGVNAQLQAPSPVGAVSIGGTNTESGNSHPYDAGAHDVTPTHIHQVSALDVTFLGVGNRVFNYGSNQANAPWGGTTDFPSNTQREFRVSCNPASPVQCTPASVGTYPDASYSP